jgi:hypothetical protein
MRNAYYKVEVPTDAQHVTSNGMMKHYPVGLVAGELKEGRLVTHDGFVLQTNVLTPVKMDAGMKEVKDLKKISGDDVLKKMMNRNSYTINGAIAGGVVGFLVAVFGNQSKLWCSLIGIVAGSGSGLVISKMVNDAAEKPE